MKFIYACTMNNDFSIKSQVSVARGHPKSAVESYKRTLKHVEFEEDEYHKGLHLPNVKFIFKTVEQLVQVLCKAVYSLPRTPNTSKVEEMAGVRLPTLGYPP